MMRSNSGCCPSVAEFENEAARFDSLLAGVSLAGVDADGVSRFLAAVRGVGSRVEAAVVRAGVRADELAATGAGAPARDTLLGSGQVSGKTARREARRSELAARSPVVGRAIASGQLGPDHLDALVRRLGRLDDDRLTQVDLDPVLNPIPNGGPGLPADTFDAVLRRAVEATEPGPGADEHTTTRANSEARHWFNNRTGMGHLTAQLDPERYESIANAIDQHTSSLAKTADGRVEKNPNLAAEALADLICSTGERQTRGASITVVVDHTTLRRGRHAGSIAETGDGHPLTDQAISRLCCNAVLQRVVLDPADLPVNVGRRFRTATTAQRAALRALYATCAWTRCDRPISHCQAHHIRHWEHHGDTDLNNLIPLCSHHHHLVHDGNWNIELHPNRVMQITRPDGTPHSTTNPPTRRPPSGPPPESRMGTITGSPPNDGHRTLTTE